MLSLEKLDKAKGREKKLSPLFLFNHKQRYFYGVIFIFLLIFCNFIFSYADEINKNPFGLMLGTPGLSLDERIDIIKDLGGVYFRPNAVIAETWPGTNKECEAAIKAGLKLILTVRNNGGGVLSPTSFPKDINVYRKTIAAIIDRYPPVVLVVENEENSKIFYTGTPEEYGIQLKAACEVAHSRGVKCTNGGLVSSLVALLVYDYYLETGEIEKARSFAQRVFEENKLKRLDSPKAKEQIEKGKALLRVYKNSGIDYINFHWYISDTEALEEAVIYLKNETELPVLTNEIGQRDDNPGTTRSLMSKIIELNFPYAIWYSVAMGHVQLLINPDGSLHPTGQAFKEFIREHF